MEVRYRESEPAFLWSTLTPRSSLIEPSRFFGDEGRVCGGPIGNGHGCRFGGASPTGSDKTSDAQYSVIASLCIRGATIIGDESDFGFIIAILIGRRSRYGNRGIAVTGVRQIYNYA